jgi:hypothetical protein
MGNVVQAVERYTNIPLDVRDRLKRRMEARQYDEIVTIRRDSITGVHRYGADIRDMHFGAGRVCRTVTRTAWAPSAVERGLVYCEGEHCIVVPTVCRNVSRITRLPPLPLTAGPAAPGVPKGLPVGTALPGTDSAATPGKGVLLASGSVAEPGELVFEPPGAGGATTTAGQAAIQAALASIASANAVDSGGFFSGGGLNTPAINFNPYGGTAAGAGGGSFAPGTSTGTGQTDPGSAATPPTPAQPGLAIDPPSPVPSFPPLVVDDADPKAPPVPEPGTWALLTAGLAALLLLRRRQARRKPAGAAFKS